MLILRIKIAYLVHLTAAAAGVACAQDYPNKPIRIITAEPASATDVLLRLMVPGLAASLGQQVIVDNRAGASGIIPIQAVAKSPPDGYALLLYGNGMWALPLMQNVPYDPVKDFLPVALIGTSPCVLVVHPSLPVKTVKELIALAKAHPGGLNYGSGGTGGTPHLAAEVFKSIAKVNIARVPYKGPASAVIGLISGETQLMFPNAPTVAPHAKSGKLRALAVTGAQPSELAPGLPTVAATVPGYESAARYAMFAPARTPVSIINRLNQELVRVLANGDAKKLFFNAGVEPAGSSPEELAAMMASEMLRLGKVVKEAGMRAD